jgi:hypothetical protein
MSYEVTWEAPAGFYVHFSGWVTPESADKLAHELTSDPRYDDLFYAIVDLTDAPGHTFRRDDPGGAARALIQLAGARFTNPRVREVAVARDPKMLNFLETYAKFTTRPFTVFPTLDEARSWLAEQMRPVRFYTPPRDEME